MNIAQQQNLADFVHSNSAHECGHMTVLFKAGRLAGLNFLPHEAAADGVKGVLETDAGTQLGKEDCVAFAAGMVGELIWLGEYDFQRLLDDREKVQQIVGQPIEDFALAAYEVIKQNLLFFTLLNIEVRKKMYALFKRTSSLSEGDYADLPNEMPIFTLAEVEQVYTRAESTLAGFHERTEAP
jgi:hypothetical protein